MTEEITCTVLVVDDMQANLRLLNVALQIEDYRVLLAKDGDEALRVIDKQPPDLILLDINIPGMSGLQVCERLKANEKTRDIPIIFLTALDDKKSVLSGFDSGAIDYVTKPFDVVVLMSRVKNHLSSKLKQDKLRDASMKDSLTGLRNRNYLDQRVAQEASLTERRAYHFL